MMQLSNQYNSFLGGEVSDSLWYRADMDKFGKWFANAENIRFTTMGGFENRPGFSRVGAVLDYKLKPIVKLVPFIFNNEEVFEIEFITGKFRVRKHGEVVVREDGSEVVYDSPIKIESLQQLKYAQSGDIIFIASGTSPVMELKRLKTDGTEWELVEFSGELPPLGEENDNKNLTISLERTTETDIPAESFDLGNSHNASSGEFYYDNLKFNFYNNNGNIYSVSVSGTISEICSVLNADEEINDNFYFFQTFTKESIITIQKTQNNDNSINKIEIECFEYQYKYSGGFYAYETDADNNLWYFKINNTEDGFIPYRCDVLFRTSGNKTYTYRAGDNRSNPEDYEEAATLFETLKGCIDSVYIEDDNIGKYIDLKLTKISDAGILGTLNATPYEAFVYYRKTEPKKYEYIIDESPAITEDAYKVTFPNKPLFKKNEIFAIKQDVQENNIKYENISGSGTSFSLVSNGKWRFYTSGNWKGNIQLQYSKDNGENWITFRNIVSNQTSEPGIFNDNTSGNIEIGQTVLMRVNYELTEGSVNINFFVPNFEVNSYYKVVSFGRDDEAYVYCIKNDIGEIEETYKWRKSAFSDELGYPESIGFYQNRLFLAKGYELWGSKINDFWDFYEPIDLQKDDPINMSILTYKVNTIKNILTTKSFFVFTTGGEFGIASQGAISQDDKFLKQFSSHGSNDCTPLVVGNIVLFVDATGNTVRAFQYSFESDNYEATDISLFIEQKLKGKQIVTTEYIRSTKECLFLDADGIVWVFKYMPEQNIMSWSHWKHGQYKITNLCVTPNGAYDELYIIVDAPDGKFIERLDSSVYSDSVELYNFEEDVEEVQTQLIEGQIVNIDDGINNKYKATVGELGKVTLRSPSKNVKIGLSYISTGTLLTPTISLQDGSFTTYRKQRVNKVFFIYKDSFGFKVGEENKEKMEIEFHLPSESIEESTALSSGKKSVLVPDTYDSNSRISFVQNEPYPMSIINVLLESDYGGQ